MIGKIPILKDDKTVAAIQWNGKKGRVVSSDKTVKKQIDDMIELRSDLSTVEFPTENGIVKGWDGFEGIMQALFAVLPSLGMIIDYNNVQRPQG